MKFKDELTNHLGNVLAVVSDRKFAVGGGTEIYNKNFNNTSVNNNTVEGWTGYNNVSITNDNGSIGFTTDKQWAGIRTVIPTVAGESYELKFKFSMTPPYPSNVGGGLAAKDGTTDEDLHGMWMNQNTLGNNQYSFVFRAKSASTALNLFNGNPEGITGSFAIDDVVITTVAHYEAEILASMDYMAYGSQYEDRTFMSESYRYGFNGKEKDDEGMGGGGSTYDYGFRIYNPQIAKFLSVDPLTAKYPELTPYQFASNRPIDCIDLASLSTEIRNKLVRIFIFH